MLLDLDTRDLITLERDEGKLLARLETVLRVRGARLLLSFIVVQELAGASRRGSGGGLMRLLLRLEELPHVWFREFDLPELEVDCALACFMSGNEYRAPRPYVESYLDAWDAGEDFRVTYRSKSLAEMIWDQLDMERRVGSLQLTSPDFEPVIALDREVIVSLERRAYQEEVKGAFIRKIRRIAAERVGENCVDLDGFSAAVWAHPEWCEGSRLQFEVQHAFEHDVQTTPTGSDVMDLGRMLHIPYVDVFTTDKSKRDYLRQVESGRNSRLRACGYWTRCKIDTGVCGVIERLEDGQSSRSDLRDTK